MRMVHRALEHAREQYEDTLLDTGELLTMSPGPLDPLGGSGRDYESGREVPYSLHQLVGTEATDAQRVAPGAQYMLRLPYGDQVKTSDTFIDKWGTEYPISAVVRGSIGTVVYLSGADPLR